MYIRDPYLIPVEKRRSSPNKKQSLHVTGPPDFSQPTWLGRNHSAHFRKRRGRVWSTRERWQHPERRVMAVAASRNHWQPSARRHDAAGAHFSPSHTPASGPQHVHLNDTSLLLFRSFIWRFSFVSGGVAAHHENFIKLESNGSTATYRRRPEKDFHKKKMSPTSSVLYKSLFVALHRKIFSRRKLTSFKFIYLWQAV